MLTLPLIAALFTGTVDVLYIGKTVMLNENEELKASLNDYIDWDNSIFVIFDSNNQVSKGGEENKIHMLCPILRIRPILMRQILAKCLIAFSGYIEA
jgi:hypothetical protein